MSSTPFIGEIRLASFNFAPKGWALCNGQLLPINQNQAIFSLLGTTYGGNGQTNFALPNLQGAVARGSGSNAALGSFVGEETHLLTLAELPAHTHSVPAIAQGGDKFNPLSGVPAVTAPNQIYSAGGSGMSSVAMNSAMVSSIGGGGAHSNMMPYLTVSFIIALQGIFPSPN